MEANRAISGQNGSRRVTPALPAHDRDAAPKSPKKQPKLLLPVPVSPSEPRVRSGFQAPRPSAAFLAQLISQTERPSEEIRAERIRRRESGTAAYQRSPASLVALKTVARA